MYKVNKKNRYSPFLFLFLAFFWVLYFSSPLPLSARSTPIRVGFVENDGFHTMEINGGYSGYNYDYLMKIAQYTGWDYEFVVISAGDSLSAHDIAVSKLERGEIDMLGSMYLTEENQEKFLFSNKNYGVSRHTLCTLGNNNTITANSFFLQESLTAALVEGDSDSIDAFYLIMNSRGVTPIVTYVETQEDAVALLLAEDVDCIMSTDVSINSNILASLTSIAPTPFYFAFSQGNEDLLEDLDQAISYIELGEYTIQQQLVAEYFGLLHTGTIILTSEEEGALADYPYLTVGLLKGREPYQFYTSDEEAVPQGISVEILEQISEIIGVEFRYVWLDSREEMRDKIASREIDLCSTVPFDSDYELTYFFDVVVTQPYLTNAVSWVHHTNEKENASPLYYYLADNIPFFPDSELTEVTDVETALKDLSTYGTTSLFADPYMAQYHIQKLGLTSVEIQNVTSMNSKICFGVGKHLDATVVGLLNHAILHLDPFVLDDIIYHNVNVQQGISLEAFFRANSFEILGGVILFFLLIVFSLLYHANKLQTISRQDSLTKLYNAGYFHKYAEEKSKKLSHGCLILIDIDYFKQVNDTYGHQMGDHIIILVGQKVKEVCQKSGLVARLGGDEFVILMENSCSQKELESKCSKILLDLKKNDTNIPVTLSIGGYMFSEPTTYGELYRMADEVLYKVKEKGRNGYLFQEKRTYS